MRVDATAPPVERPRPDVVHLVSRMAQDLDEAAVSFSFRFGYPFFLHASVFPASDSTLSRMFALAGRVFGRFCQWVRQRPSRLVMLDAAWVHFG